MADNRTEQIKIGLLAVIALLVIIQTIIGPSKNSETSGTEPAQLNNQSTVIPQGELNVPVNPAPQAAATPTTTMSFDKPDVILGNVKAGSGATHTYTGTNTGTLPLTFNNVQGDPGITIVSSPQSPIAPGSTGSITVQLSKDVQPGQLQKTIHLGANTEPAHFHLTLSATIEK